jgi:phosphate transport system protein
MPPELGRKALSEGLAQLNENMVTLSQLAQLAIRKSVESLELGDGSGAQDVFTLDEEIFALKTRLLQNCVDLIALYAPLARDLRTITASLEITSDLDRIGRYSKDIAELTRQMPREARGELQRLKKLSRMGELTIQMIDLAIDAFTHRDAEPVRNIIQEDDAVDSLHDEVFREVVDRMADRSLSPQLGAQLILINRYFERLADHAVNIGDHVAYMMTGQRLTRVKRPNSGLPFGRTAPARPPSGA